MNGMKAEKTKTQKTTRLLGVKKDALLKMQHIDDELQDIKKEMERLSLTKADKTEIKKLSYRVSNLERELAEVRRKVNT